ncbi:Uncharacterised protein [Pseudomonas fragi]|uniref:Uncharacterized protein n=1 Tax=Pseudomonas fragi TaxID=296 RepID=A0A449IKU6_PSEFR|nr:Uncharacterised protein [Pseudomonas fragi]
MSPFVGASLLAKAVSDVETFASRLAPTEAPLFF